MAEMLHSLGGTNVNLMAACQSDYDFHVQKRKLCLVPGAEGNVRVSAHR